VQAVYRVINQSVAGARTGSITRDRKYHVRQELSWPTRSIMRDQNKNAKSCGTGSTCRTHKVSSATESIRRDRKFHAGHKVSCVDRTYPLGQEISCRTESIMWNRNIIVLTSSIPVEEIGSANPSNN
jgi:hypothetical protein